MTDNAQAWTVYNSLMVDPLTHTVYSAGEEVHLPEMEYQLLYYFLQHPGQTLSRKTLMLAVWGAPPGLKTRTLDRYINHNCAFQNADALPLHVLYAPHRL